MRFAVRHRRQFPVLEGMAVQEVSYSASTTACAPVCRHARDQQLRHDQVSRFLQPHRDIPRCSPDFREQLHVLQREPALSDRPVPDGIFLTHAHIGHYAGLVHLGREAIGARGVAVFAMPRMRHFLNQNGPWNQLLQLKNIQLNDLTAEHTVGLNERLSMTPFLVPHRDEYSETVGFRISDRSRSALSQAKVRVESFAGKGGQVPKMQSTLRAVPVFGT
jgi:hypothetical protein